MQTKPLATGGIPSPRDYRDGYAAAAAASTMPTFTLPVMLPKTNLGGVLMQALEPDCVSFSIVKLMKLYFFMTTGKWLDLSPRFLAIMVKRFDGQDRATGGTYPRLVLKIAAEFGCCTTDVLPNDTSLSVLQYRNDALITPEMLAAAAQYKIPGYLSVPVDFNATRAALCLYKGVSTLLEIGDELWTPSWDKAVIDPMRTPAHIESGHQMTQNGYEDETYNDIENQWSTAWADNGANKFDYRKWQPFIVEQWAIAKVPTDVADFLKTLPSPANFHYQWNNHLFAGMAPSEEVKMFQVALMILGFLAPVAPDELGYFGPKTSVANAKYQAYLGISAVSGNDVGPLTRSGLNKQFAI